MGNSNQISEELKPVSDNPHFEAELLYCHVLKISRAELLSKVKENLNRPQNYIICR
jgi:hypothetical protein